MSETINFHPLEDIDPREADVFNDLIEEINNSVPDELKEQLAATPGGKFGQTMDFEDGFGTRKT